MQEWVMIMKFSRLGELPGVGNDVRWQEEEQEDTFDVDPGADDEHDQDDGERNNKNSTNSVMESEQFRHAENDRQVRALKPNAAQPK